MSASSPVSAADASTAGSHRLGLWLVFGAALAWSLGGMFARFLEIADPWTIVFWRSVWASAFLAGFMVWRDGPAGAVRLVLSMRGPALIVAACFAIASTAFIVALQHTTVANILLIQAGAPLIAALLARALFGERFGWQTGVAIALVFVGVAVMVSDSLTARVSLLGDSLALLIVFVFSVATVVTRRYSQVRMTPAVFLGTTTAGIVAAANAGGFAVTGGEMAILFCFGAINLGLGLALFVTGARLIPAALAALISTAEPVLGPVWVWLVHGEEPSAATLVGGGIVLAALVWHVTGEMLAHRRSRATPAAM